MNVYRGTTEIPMIEIEAGTFWEWFKRRCASNHEFKLGDGYIIDLKVLKDTYLTAFKTFVNFQFEEDIYFLNDLLLLIDQIVSIIDSYVENHYTICYIVGY